MTGQMQVQQDVLALWLLMRQVRRVGRTSGCQSFPGLRRPAG
jgi:hypothetical protein